MKKETNIITPSEISTNQDFGSFYTNHYKRFYRYAYYYVNNSQTAEDITHDALLYYWENKSKIAPETDVLGYILVTVRNKCLNYLKHLEIESAYNKKYIELYEWEIKARIMTLEDDNYTDIFNNELIELITKSIARLPEQTQLIFMKNHFENVPRKEIAAQLGVSIQKIDYHINKANNWLFKDLKEYLPLLLIFL